MFNSLYMRQIHTSENKRNYRLSGYDV